MQQPQHSNDFAEEHASPGFKASIPIRPGAAEGAGPLEGLDPDERGWEEGGRPDESLWQRFKRTIRDAYHRH
jgi:hypothetical protein